MLVSNTIRKIINLSGLLVGWLMGSGQLAAGGPLAVVLIIAATRSLRVTRSCLLAQVGLAAGAEWLSSSSTRSLAAWNASLMRRAGSGKRKSHPRGLDPLV